MGKKAGLWVDHRQAVIVHLADGQLTTETLVSNVEKHVRATGGSRTSTPYAPQDVVAGDRVDRKFEQHLETYYEAITQAVRGVESIYIMGPGEAKSELNKHLLKHIQNPKPIIKLETMDKMTEPQIIAKVKQHYDIS